MGKKKTQKPNKSDSDIEEESNSDDDKKNSKKNIYERLKPQHLNPDSSKYIIGFRKNPENLKFFYCLCQLDDFEEHLKKELQLKKDNQDKEIYENKLQELVDQAFKNKRQFTMHNRYTHFQSKDHIKFKAWYEENQKTIRFLSEGMKKYQEQWNNLETKDYKLFIRLRLQLLLSIQSCFSSFKSIEDVMKIINEPDTNILSSYYNDENFYRAKTKELLGVLSQYIQQKVKTLLENNCFSLLEDGTPLLHKNIWLKIAKFFPNNEQMQLVVVDVYDYSKNGTGQGLYDLQKEFFNKYGNQIIQFVADQGTGVALSNQDKINKNESVSYAGLIKKQFPHVLLTADCLHVLNLLEKDAEKFLPENMSNLPSKISKIIRKSPKIKYLFEEMFINITLEDLQITLEKQDLMETSFLLKKLNYTEIPQNCQVRWTAAYSVIKSVNKYYDILLKLFSTTEYKNDEIYQLLINPETRYLLNFREKILEILIKLIKFLQNNEEMLIYTDSQDSYLSVLFNISRLIINEDHSSYIEIQDYLDIDYDKYNSNFDIFVNNNQFQQNLYENLGIDFQAYYEQLCDYFEQKNEENTFNEYQEEANLRVQEIIDYSKEYLVRIIQALIKRADLKNPIITNFKCIDPLYPSKKPQWKYFLDKFPQIIDKISQNDENLKKQFTQQFIQQLDLWYLLKVEQVQKERQKYETLYDFYEYKDSEFEKKFSHVKIIGRNILLLKATSKECETYFSRAKLILQQQRSSMSFSTFRDSMIVKLNQSLIDLNNPEELSSIKKFQEQITKAKEEQNKSLLKSISEVNINDEFSRQL